MKSRVVKEQPVKPGKKEICLVVFIFPLGLLYFALRYNNCFLFHFRVILYFMNFTYLDSFYKVQKSFLEFSNNILYLYGMMTFMKCS